MFGRTNIRPVKNGLKAFGSRITVPQPRSSSGGHADDPQGLQEEVQDGAARGPGGAQQAPDSALSRGAHPQNPSFTGQGEGSGNPHAPSSD